MKLSEELVLDARMTARDTERSIAGQIEFWARLGRALEPLLRGDQALALRRAGAARPLSEAIAQADSDLGRERVRHYLETRPYPHFEPAPERPGWLIRIDQSGVRTVGRFINRTFVPMDDDAS